MKKSLRAIVILCMTAVIAATFAGCSFVGTGETPSGDISGLPNSALRAEGVEMGKQAEETREKMELPDLVDKVERTAVSIYMENTVGTSAGSGVLVDIDDGDDTNNDTEFYIITCHHVVEDGGNITVYVPDREGRDYGDTGYDENFAFSGNINSSKTDDGAVSLVGGDYLADIAVLKLDISDSEITAEDLVLAELPPSDYELREGESVFAIGNREGTQTGAVTAGVVSHIYRNTSVENIGEMTLIEISVTINHGNSGGGLYNYYGELVGITNAGRDEEHLYFAIPLKLGEEHGEDRGFENIAKQLVGTATEQNHGYVTGRWQLGVSVTEGMNRDGSSYVYVAGVVENGCCAAAGVEAGDIITGISFGGKDYSVGTVSKFSAAVEEMRNSLAIGGTFTLHIQRPSGSGFNITYVSKDIAVTVSQLIFCNTGIYPQAA